MCGGWIGTSALGHKRTNHHFYINPDANEFWCGLCKKKGGPTELAEFVAERRAPARKRGRAGMKGQPIHSLFVGRRDGGAFPEADRQASCRSIFVANIETRRSVGLAGGKMDVFELDDWLIREYEAFSRSFVQIRSEEIWEKVDAGYAQRRFWPAPLLQINPHYKGGGSLKELVGEPGLHPSTPELFRDFRAKPSDPDQSIKLHRHQAQPIEIALSNKSYIVTTGTGSGKSLCFFIPIVDKILKARQNDPSPKTRAIVIYPMNALANSQMEELRKFLGEDDQIRFARYTGQESQEEREAIRNNAPDILLTNFMMLEMLMTRQSGLDRDVLANCRGLQFIVLDELHTYRGRQGADIAMLMRRLKSRLCNPSDQPLCIGTSATMSSHPDEAERNRAVAAVASQIFGTDINADAVITETLRRATDESKSATQGLPGLKAAVLRAIEQDAFSETLNVELANDDLAIWVETRIGLKNVDVKPERGTPSSIEEAHQTPDRRHRFRL